MIEREIKLRGVAHEAVRAALAERGARHLSGPSFEDNQLWDREGELRAAAEVLRVRRVGGTCILTYKGPARYEGGAKEREELEVEARPARELDAILEALGYGKSFRYQKVRETWTLDGHEVVLDRTPLGEFVEIEGPEPQALMPRLGLAEAEPIRLAYPSLWREHRQSHPEAPADMTWPEDVVAGLCGDRSGVADGEPGQR